MTSKMNAQDLDEFVRTSDAMGGPGSAACDAYWAGLEYETAVLVDESLDPFSDDYVARQIAVYHEISGRSFDQEENENSVLDVESHVAAVNPYNHPSPGGLALHIQRLARAVHHAAPPRDGDVLDMGCGWGLSSEVMAYCGLNVTAVDINPDFVRLVETRARQRNLAIRATKGTFDDFTTNRQFDTILFYECFHHALRPWTIIENMSKMLKFGGGFALAGEPVNAFWWKHWGLRLDPMSVYCIKKFGWFESGWSLEFLQSAFKRAGLTSRIIGGAAEETGYTIIADFSHQAIWSSAEILERCAPAGWINDGEFLTSVGDSRLTVPLPPGSRRVRLDLVNFRGRDLPVTVTAGGATIFSQDVVPGRCVVTVDAEATDLLELQIVSPAWCPDDELANGDSRSIAVHLRAIGIV